MISQQRNDQITRIGPGTDAGAVLRCYWLPAALEDELAHGDKVPVNLLGELLALFHDDKGELLLATRVSNANENSTHYPNAKDIVINTEGPTYPVKIIKGAIFAYLGPDAVPPSLPNLDCFRAPDSHVFSFKGLWECNWLQALEIGIDPAHASFLHRFLEDENPDDSYGKQFRDKTEGANMPITQVLREYPSPDIHVDETDFGLKITALRHMKNELTHVRVTNQIFPAAICIPMSREMIITQWHVPVDDETCYWFTMFTSFDKPVDKKLMREQRLKEHSLPTYAPLKNKSNNYHYDPEEQQKKTFTGMGEDINVHDQWAVEGMGPIQNRTQEHLGRSDVAIIRYRRKLRAAIESVANGRIDELPMRNADVPNITGPLSNDVIADTENWEHISQQADTTRRADCPWDATI